MKTNQKRKNYKQNLIKIYNQFKKIISCPGSIQNIEGIDKYCESIWFDLLEMSFFFVACFINNNYHALPLCKFDFSRNGQETLAWEWKKKTVFCLSVATII